MQPVSSYGAWLRHRVNTELHRLQSGQTTGCKWSYTALAGILSALLIVMALFSSRGVFTRFIQSETKLTFITSKTQQTTFSRPNPDSDDWDNTVAICAMMTDAHPDDVLEWLQYHKWLGVDKIFIRENKSSMHTQHAQKFQEMVNEGYLDIGPWEGEPPEATQHWYNRCSAVDLAGAYSWVLFANLDQYLVLMDEGVALQNPDLKAFMLKRKGLAGMQLHRVLFGSSHHIQRPSPGGPLEHYTKCKDLFSFPSKCFMSSFHMCSTPFYDPDDLDACAFQTQRGPEEAYKVDVEYGDSGSPWDLHWAVISTHSARKAQPHLKDHEGEQCVGFERKLHDPGWAHSPRDVGKGEAIVLFHYVTRSYEEFMDREPTLPGVYAEKFKDRWEASRAAREEAKSSGATEPTEAEIEAKTAFDEFESRHAFNFEGPKHPICDSIVTADYPNRCCRE